MKIAVIFYTSNKLSNGEHPLMLRVSEGKTRKYTSSGISCSKALWDSNRQTPKRHHPNKDLIEAIIGQTINTYRTKSLELMNQEAVVIPHELARTIEKRKGGMGFPFF